MIKKQKIPNEPVSDFELSESDIVSDFVLRISDFASGLFDSLR